MKHPHERAFDSSTRAVLALEDGSVFHGIAIGVTGHTSGEVVFNTAITGYQEILTDPSYRGQIVTLTYPHIGNTGINHEDIESSKLHLAGLVIRDLSIVASSFRSSRTLQDHLKAEGVIAIAGIDTRRLTRILREKGGQRGAILAGNPDVELALQLARSFPGLAGLDLARVVSTREPYDWTETRWRLGSGYGRQTRSRCHVVAFDYGIKFTILRLLADRGCRITVLPAQASAADALALAPDGVFLSNGPGDPEPCDYAITAASELIERAVPVFGICLGHQIMALASGARTIKMKFGHHGINHPVQDLDTKQVIITSQNHGFAVDPSSLPNNCRITHVSLFDGSMQGFERTDRPAFSFQGHPEASPGPHDIAPLFDRFVAMMESYHHAKEN